jgi:pullulanase/glycogen debranching enzyme
MYMSERFGAWPVDQDTYSDRVEFKLFFPDRFRDSAQYEAAPEDGHGTARYGDPQIASIQVAGTFQARLGQKNWDFSAAPALVKEPHPKGWAWRYRTSDKLPAGFYEYKYFATFEDGTTRTVSDPCTRYGGRKGQNAGFTIGSTTSEMAIEPVAGGRKPQRDLIVYELMIDDFTAEYREARAPIDAIREKLDHLQHNLGVNAILFMPWTAWPSGKFNWGYKPYLYFSVEHRYANADGSPAEKLGWLRRLVNDCHQRGIHVIMDGVFNYASDIDPVSGRAEGFPYHWLYQNPEDCPYVGTFGGSFPGLLELDYHNGCTQEFIRDVCLYWIDNFNIDGICFDNTVTLYIENDSRGLPQLLKDIQEHDASKGRQNFSLTLEHIDLSAAHVVNVTDATSYWNNKLHQLCFEYLWSGRIGTQLIQALNNHASLSDDKTATTYLSNHDHAHVASQAGARNNAGALEWYRTQPYVIALFTAPGTPMIQNGEEFGESYWMMEDDQGSGRRVSAPRPLHWDFVSDPIGSRIMELYHALINLRKAHAGLRSNNFYPAEWKDQQRQFDPAGYGIDVDSQVVIYHRWDNADDGRLERFIVVINFSDQSQTVNIPFPDNGMWHDLLNGRTDEVQDYRLMKQTIDPYWGRIYFQ